MLAEIESDPDELKHRYVFGALICETGIIEGCP